MQPLLCLFTTLTYYSPTSATGTKDTTGILSIWHVNSSFRKTFLFPFFISRRPLFFCYVWNTKWFRHFILFCCFKGRKWHRSYQLHQWFCPRVHQAQPARFLSCCSGENHNTERKKQRNCSEIYKGVVIRSPWGPKRWYLLLSCETSHCLVHKIITGLYKDNNLFQQNNTLIIKLIPEPNFCFAHMLLCCGKKSLYCVYMMITCVQKIQDTTL